MSQRRISRRKFLGSIGAAGAATTMGALALDNQRRLRPASAARFHSQYLASVPKYVPAQRPDNVIVIMCDTLRYDHLGCNGNPWIQTPNLDAFASQAVVFDKAYAAGFPTLPNRCEMFSGRYTYTYLSWEELPQTETVLAQVLNDAGFITGLVFDTPHFKGDGRTMDRQFDSWEWTRGQEDDRYRATPLDPTLPADPSKFRHGSTVVRQYMRNISERHSEADYFVAQNVGTAIAWLQRTAGAGRFFLHIDCFDPHEPWDPPRELADLYDPNYSGEEVFYPSYAPPTGISAAEQQRMRALYAGEVTFVDRWLGRLFTELDALDLSSNTAVFILSDHGMLLGEHNAIGKSWDVTGHYECYPLYEELSHIVMMMRLPGVPARRTSALAQPADLMPTILDLLGVPAPSTVQASSLAPILDDLNGAGGVSVHPVVVTSRALATGASTLPTVSVTDGEWSLICGQPGAPAALYHLSTDPEQETDVMSQQVEIARSLHQQLIAFWESIGVAESELSRWRQAPC